MADKILQNPSCSKLFDEQTLSELLEKPKKHYNTDKLNKSLNRFIDDTKADEQNVKKEYTRVNTYESEEKEPNAKR